MVEDTPQDLVHDLACRGGVRCPPARPAGDRAGGGDPGVARPCARCVPPAAPTSANVVLAAAGNVEHARLVELLDSRRDGSVAESGLRLAPTQAVRRVPGPGLRFQREGHRAVPRLPGRAGDRARATSAVSRPRSSTRSSAAPRPPGSSRRSARSGGWRTRCTASPRSTRTPARSGSTSGTREENLGDVPRDRRRVSSRTSAAATSGRGARAGEGEPQGAPPALPRVDLQPDDVVSGRRLVTDSELLDVDEIVERIEAVTADEVAALAAELLRAGDGSPQPGSGPSEERVPGGRRGASTPAAVHAAAAVQVALFGAAGPRRHAVLALGARSGRARARLRPTAGPDGCDVGASTSRVPTRSSANVAACLAAGVPVVIGTTGFDTDAGRRARRGPRACPASTRRTSRSGPC